MAAQKVYPCLKHTAASIFPFRMMLSPPNGKMEDRWRIWKLPTYSCDDTKKLVETNRKFLDEAQTAIEEDLVKQARNEFESLSSKEVRRYAVKNGNNTVQLALRLRVNTILSAGWGTTDG